MTILRTAIALFTALLLAGPASAAGPQGEELVTARLVAEKTAIEPGKPFRVGVHLKMKEHWHTYWRNPGDTGIPTQVTWQLPAGFTAGPLVWPAPQRLPFDQVINYGYEGEAVLLAEISPPAGLTPSTPVPLSADVTWLACETICIPGEAKLSLSIPVVGTGAAPDPANTGLFRSAQAALPVTVPWPVKLAASGSDALTLSVAVPELAHGTIKDAYFFPYAEAQIDHAARQTLATSGDGLTLSLKRSAYAPADIGAAGGVLLLTEEIDGKEVRQTLAVGTEPAPGASGNAQTTAEAAPRAGFSIGLLAQAIAFALLGGLILNLMPCVLPVLAVKVLSLVRHSGEPAERVRRHGVAYTLGVLAAFAALTVALLSVRAMGEQIGWGFQLQSPLVVAALAYLLFAMGLSLSGVIDFGTSLAGIGGSLASRDGYSGSFFTGMLATVVATPCTAPFMGAALGFALTQPAPIALAVFMSLGLGLALPFLVLTWVPALADRLPRPGPWMITLRQALAFPLYATVAWLMWVLSQQVGAEAFFVALVGLVAVALALWALSLVPATEGLARRSAQAAALIAGIAGAGVLATVSQSSGPPPVALAGIRSLPPGTGFEPFTQTRLDELRRTNRPVFVNMTAAWCVSCIVNEKAVLSSDTVKSALARRGVTYLKGDWTNRNPEITRVLERHGRAGVPLYLLFDGSRDPIVLPQILTEAIVLESLDRLGQAADATKAELPVTSKE